MQGTGTSVAWFTENLVVPENMDPIDCLRWPLSQVLFLVNTASVFKADTDLHDLRYATVVTRVHAGAEALLAADMLY